VSKNKKNKNDDNKIKGILFIFLRKYKKSYLPKNENYMKNESYYLFFQ